MYRSLLVNPQSSEDCKARQFCNADSSMDGLDLTGGVWLFADVLVAGPPQRMHAFAQIQFDTSVWEALSKHQLAW